MIDQAATPAQILEKLGITEPADLDIDAIAYACGAFITREPLTGCEANIIGANDRAVITVNSASIESRQRFSAGHELGHWMRDRGKNAFGCSNRTMQTEWTVSNPESRANRFAADLLLPLSMFVPMARAKPITVEIVTTLSDEFKMSKTATAIRLVEHGSFPAVLVFFEQTERKWFVPKRREVPEFLQPAEHPSQQTVTARMFRDSDLQQLSGEVRADHWFSAYHSERYYLRESCMRLGKDGVLTLIWWEDEQQLLDIADAEERRSERRSGWRREE
ncbi:MAG TPA: ImmA/IrrE family metallo-endopeptidase [Terriglobia bacterium]|nr:ImmA/IrrE family metallo-endopeptidase [Terriglobia bacterium]